MIVVTHYQRLLNYIVPDFVHVLVDGRIVALRRQGAGARARGEGLRVAREGAAARPCRAAPARTEARWKRSPSRRPGAASGEVRSRARRHSRASPAGSAALRREAFGRFEALGLPDAEGRGLAATRDSQPITEIVVDAAAPAAPRLAKPPSRPAHALLGPGRRPRAASAGIAGVREERLRRAEHGALRGRRADSRDRARAPSSPSRSSSSSTPATPDAPEAAYPRVLMSGGRALRGHGRRELRRIAARTFTNAVTEIVLAAGAILEHYKLQEREPRGAATCTRSRSSRLAAAGSPRTTSPSVPRSRAPTSRPSSAGEGAECALNGLFVGRGRQHLDNHTVIDHATPHCTSRELYKGSWTAPRAASSTARSSSGRTRRRPTPCRPTRTCCSRARPWSTRTPALEIFADDVKCKHGSTTGQLDAAALFYLRSRGIGEAEARALLTYAFAADVVEKIRVPSIRRRVERELGLRLPGAASTSGEAA